MLEIFHQLFHSINLKIIFLLEIFTTSLALLINLIILYVIVNAKLLTRNSIG